MQPQIRIFLAWALRQLPFPARPGQQSGVFRHRRRPSRHQTEAHMERCIIDLPAKMFRTPLSRSLYQQLSHDSCDLNKLDKTTAYVYKKYCTAEEEESWEAIPVAPSKELLCSMRTSRRVDNSIAAPNPDKARQKRREQ